MNRRRCGGGCKILSTCKPQRKSVRAIEQNSKWLTAFEKSRKGLNHSLLAVLAPSIFRSIFATYLITAASSVFSLFSLCGFYKIRIE